MVSLGLRASEPAKDEAVQKTVFGSGMAALITSNEEREDIMKIVKFLG